MSSRNATRFRAIWKRGLMLMVTARRVDASSWIGMARLIPTADSRREPVLGDLGPRRPIFVIERVADAGRPRSAVRCDESSSFSPVRDPHASSSSSTRALTGSVPAEVLEMTV